MHRPSFWPTAVVTLGFSLVAAVASLAGSQIGYLWSFEELVAKADLVVIAEAERTERTGNRTKHPELRSDLPVIQFATALEVLAVLKADTRVSWSDGARVRLKHYGIDIDEWRRRNPPQPGLPPPGLVNTGSFLDFSDERGPYLLFLRRGSDEFYEPLSGHTFPTESVFLLKKLLKKSPG